MSDEPKPVRLHRSRAKGARLVSPNGLGIVCVTRPGKWGNPYSTAGEFRVAMAQISKLLAVKPNAFFYADENVRLSEMIRDIAELRGKNLACFCKLGDACHADVLLEIANG